MTTIILIGDVAKKRAIFRQELKSLPRELEIDYVIDYMCLADTSIQIICKYTDGAQPLDFIYKDASKMIEYLEYWTEFRLSSISIY